jgi:hypothetical protein
MENAETPLFKALLKVPPRTAFDNKHLKCPKKGQSWFGFGQVPREMLSCCPVSSAIRFLIPLSPIAPHLGSVIEHPRSSRRRSVGSALNALLTENREKYGSSLFSVEP